MSADASQGAFRGLRSRSPHYAASSTTNPVSSGQASLQPVDALTTPASSSFSTTYPYSQDRSPRPKISSNLRHVILSDTLESPDYSYPHTDSPTSPTATDEEQENLDFNHTPTRHASMSTGDRPKLKLNLITKQLPRQDPASSAPPQSVTRTPSIKLLLKPSAVTQPSKTLTTTPAVQQKRRKKSAVDDATPGSSAKKRKQPDDEGSEDELERKPAQIRKLTLTTKPPTLQSPITPTLKFKYKGRIPKRPLGLGYDSELDEREPDPTILESFILRMPPGPDCDYLRDAVQHSTIGMARSQGGADVQMKFLDRFGRRGLIIIRGQRWAATLVDLPCIIEGMKSWDKKGWVKSADICQMLLVLGKVQNESQAEDFPLPKDVNPQTWQYAHGITPPMRYVRQRRFARTNRTSVNAIEAVERKVNQLLADDEAAISTRFELFDTDPTTRAADTDSDTEEGEEYDEDEDADGDDVGDDYFGERNGTDGNAIIETPTIAEHQDPEGDDDADDDFIGRELEAMEGGEKTTEDSFLQLSINEPPGPDGGSSVAIMSTSPSATGTAAQTPAEAETSGAEEDSEDFNEEEEEEEESMDEEDREATAQNQKALDEVQELKEALKEQMAILKSLDNPILKRKVISRIEQIEGDLEAARRTAGLGDDAEDEAEDA